jgi:hypothetical protein
MTRRYERCKVPALFLFGDHDQLIPVDESVVVIQRVLAEDKHHDFTIRVFPNVDHEMRLPGPGRDRSGVSNDHDGLAVRPRSG